MAYPLDWRGAAASYLNGTPRREGPSRIAAAALQALRLRIARIAEVEKSESPAWGRGWLCGLTPLPQTGGFVDSKLPSPFSASVLALLHSSLSALAPSTLSLTCRLGLVSRMAWLWRLCLAGPGLARPWAGRRRQSRAAFAGAGSTSRTMGGAKPIRVTKENVAEFLQEFDSVVSDCDGTVKPRKLLTFRARHLDN